MAVQYVVWLYSVVSNVKDLVPIWYRNSSRPHSALNPTLKTIEVGGCIVCLYSGAEWLYSVVAVQCQM